MFLGEGSGTKEPHPGAVSVHRPLAGRVPPAQLTGTEGFPNSAPGAALCDFYSLSAAGAPGFLLSQCNVEVGIIAAAGARRLLFRLHSDKRRLGLFMTLLNDLMTFL